MMACEPGGTAVSVQLTRVYTDGSCQHNPGPGGWAYVVDGGPWGCGFADATTNQRMELCAAAEAVAAVDGPAVVVSDSSYVVRCFVDGWWRGWVRRGWRTAAGRPVANRDLWEPFVEEVRIRGDVGFEWVKGHAGHPMNEAADRLAVHARNARLCDRGTSGPPGPDVFAGVPEQLSGAS